jgi:phosphoserine phosphatase RsbU/P
MLKVIRGPAVGEVFELRGDRISLGRHPSCQIVLDDGSVSRHHAQIVVVNGQSFLEDLRSRNGTQVNGTSITSRTELVDGDTVTICDYTFQFVGRMSTAAIRTTATVPVRRMGASTGRIPKVSAEEAITLDDQSSEIQFVRTPGSKHRIAITPEQAPGSSIIASFDASDPEGIRITVQPEVKLRAVLELGAALGQSLKMNDVLSAVLKALFSIFPQADWGFVLLKDPATKRLSLRASRSRKPDDEDSVPVSLTIVKSAMETKQAILSGDAQGDQRFDSSESLAVLSIRSLMCVPLIGKGNEALGVIQLSASDLVQHFTPEDLDLLTSVASPAALAVENAYLHEAALKQRDFERELEFATQVQTGFLPHHRPDVPGYQFADYYEPAYRVGGDYYDYVSLPDGRLAIAIADVAGKGIPAALLMARLHGAVRYRLLSTATPAETLKALNAEIVATNTGFRFITMALAVLNPATGVVTLASAGHLPAILRKVTGESHLVGMEDSGMPLGIQHRSNKQGETVLQLEPGDSLVLYTDGITEAMNPSNDIFGMDQLQKLVAESSPKVDDLVPEIVTRVAQFCGTRAQSDDMCVVAFSRVSANLGGELA